MTPQERLVNTALSEVGYVEKASLAQLDDKTANPGTGNFNKYAAILDNTDVFNGRKQGADWCAVFVCCMFYLTFGLEVMRKITGIPARSMAAGVGYLRQYFQAIGGIVSEPQPGDVIFFRTADLKGWQHTGIVTAVSNGCVETVEGNAGTPQGVNTFRYPLSWYRIGGYGRAKWNLVPAETAPGTPAEQEDEPVSNTPTYVAEAAEWSAEAREWAVYSNLISGDGRGNYMWPESVTREQLAVILYKYDQMRFGNGA